jgi:Putative transposase, YhgA-like
MAVRTQVYQGLLWQQVIDEKKLKTGARLPPLLLLVLYNGVQPWSAATEIRELIALSPDSALWPWQPQVRYYLLDMSAFPRDELARRASLAALLFRLEQRHPPEEFPELLGEVIGWFRRHQGYERLRELFAELAREALVDRGIKVSGSEDLLKMRTNVATHYDYWKQQWLAEREPQWLAEREPQWLAERKPQWLAEHKPQWLAEGKAQGLAEGLVCLLAARFGAVPPSLRKQIRGAKLPTLERWFKRAIAAPDLRSIFARPR